MKKPQPLFTEEDRAKMNEFYDAVIAESPHLQRFLAAVNAGFDPSDLEDGHGRHYE